MAPELLKGEGYSHAADWWTFGSIIYEMITGKPPFYCKDRKKTFRNIIDVFMFYIYSKNEIEIKPSLSKEAQ